MDAQGAVQNAPTLVLVSGSGVFDFGSSRAPQTRVLVYAVQPQLPNGQRIHVQPVDFVSGGHVIPARNTKIGKRFISRRRMFRVVVRVDPGGAAPGAYAAELPISAAGRVLEKAELSAKVRDRLGSENRTIFLAFLAILLGAAGGAVLKWLADSGSKLQALHNRYDRVLTVLGTTRLPTGLRQQLLAVQTSLDALSAEEAEKQLAPIESHLDSIVRLGVQYTALNSAADEQLREVEQINDNRDTWQLRAIVRGEKQELAQSLEDAWPDPATGQARLATAARGIQLFSHFLGAFNTDDSARRDALRKAIPLFRDGKFDEAEKVMTKESGAASVPPKAELTEVLKQIGVQATETTASALTAKLVGLVRGSTTADVETPPAPSATAQRPRGVLQRVGRRFIRRSGFVSGSIIAFVVALVGLSVLYFPDETFGGAEDWLTLILWGFGVQLAGFSLAQLGGRTLGSGPRIAEAPRA
jgi:hypothetical protein